MRSLCLLRFVMCVCMVSSKIVSFAPFVNATGCDSPYALQDHAYRRVCRNIEHKRPGEKAQFLPR